MLRCGDFDYSEDIFKRLLYCLYKRDSRVHLVGIVTLYAATVIETVERR